MAIVISSGDYSSDSGGNSSDGDSNNGGGGDSGDGDDIRDVGISIFYLRTSATTAPRLLVSTV